MKKIMVFDVPAESGGALTILEQYYKTAVKEKDKEWIFIVSTPQLEPREHIKVVRFPWVKKTWFHRLYFDWFVAKKLVSKYNADEVLSLQNVIIPGVTQKQILYLHQPLPFVEKRYGIGENFKYWIYQNIISKMIYRSIRQADKVIVQTKWVINVAMNRARVNKDKFVLEQPKLHIEKIRKYDKANSHEYLFFYPAGAMPYKNHEIIVKASILLKNEGIEGYRVIFTLKGNENKHIAELIANVKKYDLPIEFIGSISLEEVYEYYSKSTLIFPSYIETFGLPLLEARVHECPIIVSNCAFSLEILEGYEKAKYFDPFNMNELAGIIKDTLSSSNLRLRGEKIDI